MDRVAAEQRIRAAMDAAQCEMRWGKDDCATWVADIVAPLISRDPMSEFRGRYRSKFGAARVMGRGGMKAAIERIAYERGWAWMPPDRAQTGDIAISKVGDSVMICLAPDWFVGRAEFGFCALRGFAISQAWTPK